jgi:putative tryptophan/tyrosine transport system substrate-binding protein
MFDPSNRIEPAHRRSVLRALLCSVCWCLPMFSLCEHANPADAANIAVLMSANVDAYRAALKGFKATARHRVVAEYDMGGDLNAGRKALAEMRKTKPELILAVGIWALQLVVEQPPDVPVVYAMVLNPPSVIGEDTKNITGASMNVPVKSTMEMVRKLSPQIHRVGVVFDPTKTGYLVKRAETAARDEGLELIAKPISSSREAIYALDALQGAGIDAIWIAPDETVLQSEIIQHLLLMSYNKKLPVIGLSPNHAQLGAVLSLQFGSSEDIGKQAAELANTILDGRSASQLPYTTVRQLNVIVNLKAAQKIGLAVPDSILGVANTVLR